MAKITAKQVNLDPAEQSLLARLGIAVLHHWSELSGEQRSLVREQAIVTEVGDEISVQMAEQVDKVISRYAQVR